MASSSIVLQSRDIFVFVLWDIVAVEEVDSAVARVKFAAKVTEGTSTFSVVFSDRTEDADWAPLLSLPPPPEVSPLCSTPSFDKKLNKEQKHANKYKHV